MAFTLGTLYGQFNGNTLLLAFNSSNPTNPNAAPVNDLFQVRAPGGNCLLQVTAAGVVNINLTPVSPVAGPQSWTNVTQIATVQLVESLYAGLPAVPTASQICAVAFPSNFNTDQLDIFQIATNIAASSNQSGGNGVVFRLLYNGSTATS